jgi:hypothetical protein
MGLLQRAVDVGKPGVEVGAKAVDHSNDRTRNTRCNQPVFDGGGAGFVFQEMPRSSIGRVDMPPSNYNWVK